jgi:hypothetical protein
MDHLTLAEEIEEELGPFPPCLDYAPNRHGVCRHCEDESYVRHLLLKALLRIKELEAEA